MNDLSSGSEQRDRIVEGSKERNPVDRNKMLSSIRNGIRQIKKLGTSRFGNDEQTESQKHVSEYINHSARKIWHLENF